MHFQKQKISLFAGSIILIFFFIEGLCRLLLPAHAPFLAHARTTPSAEVRSGWTPSWRGDINVDGVGGQTGSYTLRINPFGFRGASMKTAEKPEGTVRIFFMGGSFVEQLAMPEEKTFPSLLEKKLTETFPKIRFECVNAGISGFMSPDLPAQLQHQIMNYQPDLIVVTVPAANDLRYGTLPQYDPAHPLPSTALQKLKWYEFSRILHLLYRGIARWQQAHTSYADSLEKLQSQARKVPPSADVTSISLPVFEQNLRRLIAMAKEKSTSIILTSEPSIYTPTLSKAIRNQLWIGLMQPNLNLSPEFMREGMQRYNTAAAQLADQTQIPFVDLAGSIPKTPDFFYDDMHLSPSGSKVTAKSLEPAILKQIQQG